MKLNIFDVKPDKSGGRFGRPLQFACYDWTRDMPWTRRWLTELALVIQAAALSTALVGTQSGILGPKKVAAFLVIGVTYVLALLLMNGMLTSEFVRKTQLEADQIAAEQIQRTLHPQELEELPGYRRCMPGDPSAPLRGVSVSVGLFAWVCFVVCCRNVLQAPLVTTSTL